MAPEHVLRIPRTDSPGDFILLNTTSNGSSPLDLQLLATEGSEPYVKTCKHFITLIHLSTFMLTDQVQ